MHWLIVPSLNDTCRRYLDSMQPLLGGAEFERLSRLAQDFRDGQGRTLQRLLWLKSQCVPVHMCVCACACVCVSVCL